MSPEIASVCEFFIVWSSLNDCLIYDNLVQLPLRGFAFAKLIAEVLAEIQGVLNMDGAVVLNGALNASHQQSLFCGGETGRLYVHLSNEGLKRLLNGETFCGETWKYRFAYTLDMAKQKQDFHLVGSNGFEYRVNSSSVTHILNESVQAISTSGVYIGGEHKYTVVSNVTFSGGELVQHLLVARVSDGETVCSATFNFLLNYSRFGLLVDLPTVADGFLLDSGVEVDLIRHRTFMAKSLVTMYSLKRGFEFTFFLGKDSIFPIILNASVHGLQTNRSFIVDFDADAGVNGFDQAGLVVKTHADDEFVMKISKSAKNEDGEGEFSILCSIHPGIPSENFTGFLYKTQLSWAFTPVLLKLEQHGEWNEHKATPPGMPFRYGIRFSKNPTLNGGELQVYGEDTNMGKTFGFEMLEGLFMYEADTKKESVEFESNILFNWRRFLGRGIIGSQATIKAKVDKAMKNGNAEFVWSLPDAKQTQITAAIDCKIDKSALKLTSKAMLGDEQVHKGKLKTKWDGSSWKIDFGAEIYDLSMKFDYEGDLALPPSFEVETSVVKTETELARVVIVATSKKMPKIRLHFAPSGLLGSDLTSIDAKLESSTSLKDMSLTNLDINGYFKTQPIISDSEFKLKTSKDLRQVETSISVTQPNNVLHKEEGTFKISRDGKSLALDVHIDSPLLTKGPLKIATKHECSSGNDKSYEYDLRCSGQEKYSMTLKNKKTSKRVFEEMITTFTRILSGTTSVEMNADNKHVLRLVFTNRNSGGEVKVYLKLDDKVILDAASSGMLAFSNGGFLADFWMILHGANGSVATARLELSNVPTRREIDLLVSSSLGLGRHDFALRADAGYLLNLLANPDGSQRNSQLKRYLLRFDNHAFGLEFTTPSACMITFSLPSLPVPVALRVAYNLSQENALRGVLQVSEPVQIETRVLLDFKGEIYLALASKTSILDSINYMRLTDQLGGKTMTFAKGGCAKSSRDCISFVLGSAKRDANQFQFIFSLVIPIFGEVRSVIIDSEFSGRIPRSLFIGTKDREVGFGAWVDPEKDTVSVETAWHRQKGGFLFVTVGRKYVKIGDLKRLIDIGTVNRTYYIHATHLETGLLTRYLEVTPHDKTKFEVRSFLLKDPIFFVYHEDREQRNLKLLRGTLDDLTTVLLELSIKEEPLDHLRSRSLIMLTRNDKSIAIDTIRDKSAVKQAITSKISIKGDKCEFYYERIPGRKIFLNFSDSIIFEISKEKQYNGVAGNLAAQYRMGTVKMDGQFRTSTEPMQLFATLKSAQTECVLEGNMTSLLNVAGSLKHSKDNENVLDAELSTYMNEERGFYHLNGFWRSGLLFDILADGVKNTLITKIPFFIAEVEENLSSLLTEGLNQMRDLFNEQALELAWMSTKEWVGDLLISFNGISSTATIGSSDNNMIAARAEALYDQIMHLMDKIQKTIAKLDPRALYSPARIAKFLQVVESSSRTALEKIKKLLTYPLWGLQMSIEFLDEVLSANVNSIQSVLTDAARQLMELLDHLSQGISDLKSLRKGVTNVTSEVYEAVNCAYDSCQNTFESFFESLTESVYRPLSLLDHLEASTFEADWSNITVNATVSLPLWIRRSAGLIIAPYYGYPLSNTPFEKLISKFSPLFGRRKKMCQKSYGNKPTNSPSPREMWGHPRIT
ncbi:hypothetical protein Aperf_G00000003201 [Anoplocephala perfoliata]